MLMHVCPIGHAALILIHSLISMEGKTEKMWLDVVAPQTQQVDRLSPLCKTTNRHEDALIPGHGAASQLAPRFRQHTPP